MLAAFINNTHTRLDTSDIPMWRRAGLKIAPDGLVFPSNPQHPDFEPENAMSDDMISNAFIWLLAKLVNFVVHPDDMPDNALPSNPSARQNQILEYWESLDAQLTTWLSGLPDSFYPTAVQKAHSRVDIEEQWYPRPKCASTMQWWHFARIQLLNNKPHVNMSTTLGHTNLGRRPSVSGTSLAARYASYASIIQQSREHAKQIVAIGLGRSDEGARVHGVQPLWTAGLVLGVEQNGNDDKDTEMWRRSILSQLRGIERDMGWASEYRVQSLLELWGLPINWGLDMPP